MNKGCRKHSNIDSESFLGGKERLDRSRDQRIQFHVAPGLKPGANGSFLDSGRRSVCISDTSNQPCWIGDLGGK